jgi:hypothetical protein
MCTSCVVTYFPRAVTSGSERKVLTTDRGRGAAASPFELLHTIHGSVLATSVAGFANSQIAVGTAKAASSQGCPIRREASVAIMTRQPSWRRLMG